MILKPGDDNKRPVTRPPAADPPTVQNLMETGSVEEVRIATGNDRPAELEGSRVAPQFEVVDGITPVGEAGERRRTGEIEGEIPPRDGQGADGRVD